MEHPDPLHMTRDRLSQKIADALRRLIIRGELPDGQRLVEGELAARMGTSRAPLREALAILAREGLVAITPGKGTCVRGLTETRIRHLFVVRGALDLCAAELAAQRIDQQQAAHLRGLATRLLQAATDCDRAETLRFDSAIHRTIRELSGNEYLVETAESLVASGSVLTHLIDDPTPEELRRNALEHERLIETVASGDPALAVAAMREHLAVSVERAVEALQVASRPVR